MIDKGFLICTCGKKIQPIEELDTMSTTVYCHVCKKYWYVVIARGILYRFEKGVSPVDRSN